MADQFSYIAFDDADSAVGLCCDDPEYKKDTAKHVAEWIRKGRRVERMEHHAACARFKADWEKSRAQAALQMTEV